MIVGLEICGDTVRAVRLGRSRAGGAAQSVVLPLDAGRVPIARLVEKLGVRNPAWGVAFPSSWCSYRTIALPYNAPGRVAATFRYALDGRLPGSVEGYCIEALSAPRAAGEKGCRMTVAACPKEKIRDLVAQLKQSGVSPRVAQPAVLTLGLRFRGELTNGLILRVGPETEVAVIQRGELVAADVLPPLTADGPDSAADVAEFVERLRFALRAMELSWGGFAFDRCVLIAPDSAREALAGAVAGALKIPVNPPPEEAGGAEYAVAWGIAVQVADKAHLAPSLLQGEFAHPALAKRYERRAAVALVMAILIVLLVGVRTTRQLLDAHAAERDGRSHEAELYRQVLPGATGTPSLDRMNAELARLKKEGGNAGGGNVSAVAAWAELTRLIPPGVTLEYININNIRISLRARSTESAWDFQKALGKSAMLSPGQPSDVRPSGSGVTTFSMEVKYR